LCGGDYGEVMRCIKRCVSTDSNVAVIGVAVDAAQALAKGLRREWRAEARTLTPVLLDKLKDKTTNVIRAIHAALSAFNTHCYALGDVIEDVAMALSHKVPKVQTESLKWVTACIASADSAALAKLVPHLLPLLLKCTDDASPAVRDGALLALQLCGTNAPELGAVAKAIDGLDAARKKRLAELNAQQQAAPELATTSSTNGSADRAAPASQQPQSRPTSAPQSDASSSAPATRRPSAAVGVARSSSTVGAPSSRGVSDDAELDDSGGLSAEEVGAAVDAFVGADVRTRLGSGDWKERLQGMNTLLSALAAKPPAELTSNTETVLRQLANAPGWSDSNFQVVGKGLEVVSLLASTSPGFSRRNAVIVMHAVVDKAADVKLKSAAADCLAAFSKTLGHRFVVGQLARRAAAHRNPKVLEVALTWVASELETAGGAAFDAPALIEMGKAALNSSNPNVKTAAIKLMGIAHAQYGPLVANAVTALKPALVATLQAEFAKCPFQGVIETAAPAPAAAATHVLAPARVADAALPAASAFAPASDVDITLLVDDSTHPREDVSSKITAKLIKDLGSAQWKERQAALDAVDGLVNSAGRRVNPASLGVELMPALRGRLTDSNKMLTIQALGTIALVAEACGPGSATEKAFRPVFPEFLKSWADPKKQVREAVSKALSAYACTQPLERLLPAVAACIAEPKSSMDAKKDALVWLTTAVKAAPETCDLTAAFSATAMGLTDKSGEIRECAAALCSELAAVATEDGIQRALRGLPREAQVTLLERIGPIKPGGAAAAMLPPPLAAEDSIARVRPGTASTSLGGGRPGTASSVPTRPATAGAAGGARAASTAPAVGKGSAAPSGLVILPCPPERRDERLAKLPRKALGLVGGKDVATDVRDSSASEELNLQLSAYIRADVHALMASDDFKKHITAAEELEAALSTQLGDVVSVLDLLLRWSVARLCELAPNTSSLLRVLDWLAALLDTLSAAGLKLRDEEAVLLMPVVLDKSGHNLPAVRERFRRIMRGACTVMPVPKFVGMLALGLSSKNSRSRVECLEELAAVVGTHGFEAVERSGARIMPTIVALAGERDAAVRKAASDALVACYCSVGDSIWKHCGQINAAQQQMLDGLFRKTMQRTSSTVAAPVASQHVQAPSEAPVVARAPSFGVSQFATPPRLDTRPPADLQSSELMLGGSTPAVPPAPSGSSSLSAWTAGLQTLERVDASDEQVIAVFKVIANTLADLSGVDDSVVAAFVADADTLVALLVRHSARMFAVACGAAQQPAPSRGCKYALNACASVFAVPRIAAAVSEPTLRVAIGELLLLLLDDRVAGIAEGTTLVRSLNVLMLRILEHASRTASFVALLLMLRQPPAGLTGSAAAERRVRFFDLAVKCLIKLTKTLSQSLAGLDVSEVLLTIHSFFMLLGVDEIRRRGAEDDRPLRMVKTVLYELTKALGPTIKDHMQKIPPPTFEPAPIIYAYINLNLQSLAAQPQIQGFTGSPAQPGDSSTASRTMQAVPMSPLGGASAPGTPGGSDPQRVLLAAIFRKIGDKNTSMEGIEELYDFRADNPSIDITPHIAKTSDAFQLYIQRGLAQVEARRAAAQQAPPPTAGGGKSAAEQYQERLLKVKAAQQAAGAVDAPAGGVTSAAISAGSRQNLDALRERMRSVAAMTAAVTTTAPVAPAQPPAQPAAMPEIMVAPPVVAPPVVVPEPVAVAAPAVRAGSTNASVEDLQQRLARIKAMSQASKG